MIFRLNWRWPIFCFLTVLISACSPTFKYKETAKVWEPEIQKLEALDKKETDPENGILFIGSSSIRLWKNIKTDMAPYPVIQRGFGGAKFDDLLFFTKRLVYSHDFRAVVIFVANDIAGDKNDKTPHEVLSLFKSTEKIIRKKYNDKPLFFIGITPNKLRWRVWPQAREANLLIETYCKSKKNLHFITTESSYLGSDGQPVDGFFLADQLHLTQKGYDLWAKIIKENLDRNLK